MTKKDVFETIAGIFMTFAMLGVGYYAGSRNASKEFRDLDNRIDGIESRVFNLENK